MARAKGNDLCELFGYAPDDTSQPARKQWKSQKCPFVGGVCIKHSHPQPNGSMVVYGSCSVINKTRSGEKEEVIICPHRLYADNYRALKACIEDATGKKLPAFMAFEYSKLKKENQLPKEYVVLLGHSSGREISLSNPGVIQLSLDWVMVYMKGENPELVIPCEVQSIDITGNYHKNWEAYSKEAAAIPDSRHGMNWANVWKRLIPQLILKSSIAVTSNLCRKGLYFVVPERVYCQFDKIVGSVKSLPEAAHGALNVMTYKLGDPVTSGKIRDLEHIRTVRMKATEFAASFASGKQMPLGTQLDTKIIEVLASL